MTGGRGEGVEQKGPLGALQVQVGRESEGGVEQGTMGGPGVR
jgi:hypothetical protein